jgi:MoaA/NifB/PqqE/SkfB family radical SAM enzyme
MIKDSLLGIAAALLKSDKILNSPLNMQIEPTTFCNLQCKMCIRNDKIISPAHMSEPVFKNAMNKLTPGRVVFAGAGEPLLSPMIAEFVNYCTHKKIPSLMSTNLSMDIKPALAVLQAGLATLKVSLDAPNRETYAAVRGNGDCFDKITTNIKELTSKPGRKYDVRLEYVIMKDNFEGIVDFIELARKLGISRVYFRELQTEGMAEARRKDLLEDFNFAELKKQMKNGIIVSKKVKVETNLSELLDEFNSLIDIYNRTTIPTLGASCMLPWLQMFVSVNGDVSPCCALTTNGGIKTGNVVDNSRRELLNGVAIKCIRKGFREGKLAPVCRDCIPRNFKKLLRMSKLLPGFKA